VAHESKIEWTEATWNPWHGCHKVSAGCKNCYMFRDKAKYGQDPNVVVRSKTRFYDPLKWKEPRTIFTCSWSDFFIEEADPWRDEAFAIMALTPQHTYQVLTKRPERMLEYLGLHWVIAGGESGPDARPMHPGKARSLRDQCTAASVPFFFKQWGEWLPARDPRGPADRHEFPDGFSSQKVGKKKAGRELDGRTWDEMPAIN
jgi:protein gp37